MWVSVVALHRYPPHTLKLLNTDKYDTLTKSHFYQQKLCTQPDAINKHELQTLMCGVRCNPRTFHPINSVGREHHNTTSTLPQCHQNLSQITQPTIMKLM